MAPWTSVAAQERVQFMDSWVATLREECRLRVFKNRILREMKMGSGEGSKMRNVLVSTVHVVKSITLSRQVM